jgi:hypothetical protein
VGVIFAAKAMAASEIIIAQMFGFGKPDPARSAVLMITFPEAKKAIS